MGPNQDKNKMSEITPAQQKAELRRLFAVRMPKKLRHLNELWQRNLGAGWTPTGLAGFIEHCERVKLSAANFEFNDVELLVHEIATLHTLLQNGHAAPSDEQVRELQTTLLDLADQLEGHGGVAAHTELPVLSGEDEALIGLLLADPEQAADLARQIAFFGYRAQLLPEVGALAEINDDAPFAALLVDLDLPGVGEALGALHARRSHPLPSILLATTDDLATRLAAVRAGGDAFFEHPLALSDLIHRLDALTTPASPEPYRVMVVEDSRAQAKHADIVLKSVGFSSHVVTEPMKLMEALVEFHPELILMDMQMPEVSGLELARVLRQHPGYAGIPIVFLSAEDDAQKRLTALTIAGDDFLTKPLRADQLVEAVSNRAQRARAVQTQKATDALTGLLNRQHFLTALEAEVSRAGRTSAPLALAVLDVDGLARINQQHGQHVGDHVLQALARLFAQRLRKTDTLGRIGDDRVGILLPNCNAPNAVSLLTQLCRQFSGLTHRTVNGEVQAKLSGGLALLTDHAVGPLMTSAELALTDAKRQGGNRIVLAQEPPAPEALGENI